MRKGRSQIDRRRFLGLAGGYPALGAVALLLQPRVGPQQDAPRAEKSDGRRKTEHVKRFYRLARF